MIQARPVRGILCLIAASISLFAQGAEPGRASTSDSQTDASAICRRVAQEAAAAEEIPFSVMMAISLTETGRKSAQGFTPWPWTVNLEGKGYWFTTASQALEFAEAAFAKGARSFDVGCFQINYKWHGQAFASIHEMFDPRANARYAARLLKRLFAERGSWPQAAGAYHSQNPEHAGPYAARFERIRDGLIDRDAQSLPELPEDFLASFDQSTLGGAVPENNFPLLQGGGGAALASLVPVENSLGGALIGAPDALPIVAPEAKQ